jgi:hypothetical protein
MSARVLSVVTLTMLLSVGAVAADSEYAASVRQSFSANSAPRGIGIVPFACPQEFDCKEFEEILAEQLASASKRRIVASQAVHDLMQRATMSDLEQLENRLIIAEGLGVDAFAFVDVRNLHVDTTAPPSNDKWKNVRRTATAKRASLELKVIARDGVVLADVSGEAELFDSMKSLQGIATRLLEVMLERASN